MKGELTHLLLASDQTADTHHFPSSIIDEKIPHELKNPTNCIKLIEIERLSFCRTRKHNEKYMRISISIEEIRV